MASKVGVSAHRDSAALLPMLEWGHALTPEQLFPFLGRPSELLWVSRRPYLLGFYRGGEPCLLEV